jgi:choline dehydrogenase-like flavoprotein
MTKLPKPTRELILTVVRAFCPEQAPLPAEQIAARGVRFLEDLLDNGSEGMDRIQELLTFLDLALFLVNRKDRKAVRKRLTDLERGKGLAGIAPDISRGLARFAQRLAVFLTYATLDEAQRPVMAHELGYEEFPARRPGPPPALGAEDFLPPEMWVQPEAAVPDRVFDVAIIGSGSGGAVVARRLVEQYGLDVAVIEAGDYLPEAWTPLPPTGRPRPLPWDEVENLLRFYKNGGLQMTSGDASMFIFQGQCLGGSSVVNNAVCFRMPDELRAAWQRDFGIPWTGAELDQAYARIATELDIGPATERVKPGLLNPSGRFFGTGADGTQVGAELTPCDVNLSRVPGCEGCGYCNLVCAFLRKNSVLQTMFPAAWRSAAAGQGRLTVLTGRRALAIQGTLKGKRFRAQSVVLRRRLGGPRESLLARKVVVAAGAIASSGLLLRSDGINDLGLPLGKRFSFNFGSPVHADFDAEVRAYDGLQIAHYCRPPAGEGFVLETWFNPPATQSLALPGWMDDLQATIARYTHLACAAPLVGSTAKSRITSRLFAEGENIEVELDEKVDLPRLKAGLLRTCELFFAADPPPRRVLLGRLDGWQVTRRTYAARIKEIKSFKQIQIGTGHPQGGNCLAAKSGAAKGLGVVAPDFRLHGADNVFVADASVFPTSLGVNPHWTVMALADLAAAKVAALP